MVLNRIFNPTKDPVWALVWYLLEGDAIIPGVVIDAIEACLIQSQSQVSSHYSQSPRRLWLYDATYARTHDSLTLTQWSTHGYSMAVLRDSVRHLVA